MKHATRLVVSTLLAVTIGFGSLLSFPWFVHAQTEQSSSPSAELREIIRQRIEETIQEKKTTKTEYIGTLGTITKVSSSTFSMIDTLGLERTVELTNATTLLVDGDPATLADISINAGVVVMGTALDEVVINAKRILVQDEDFSETREVFLGSITKKSNTSITISNRGTGEMLDLALLRTTSYEDSLGNTISLKNVQEDQSVLIVTNLNKNKERFVSRLRLLVPVESLETE